MKSNKKYYLIDIFRYICAVMVVAIHTYPFAEINKELCYVFNQIIPQIAVPFFFAVSGFFYIQKLEKGEAAFCKYIKRLLITYSAWSCVYYLIDFIHWGHSNIKGFVVNCVYCFIIDGSYYHFWFFPALIFSVVIVTLMWRIKLKKVVLPLSILLYVIGCIGTAYNAIGVRIPILKQLYLSQNFVIIRRWLLMGFPLFVSGFVAYRIKQTFENKLPPKKIGIVLIVSVFLWLAEIEIVRFFEIQNEITITFGLYFLIVSVMLWLMSFHKDEKFKEASEKCRVLAGVTYYSHPLIVSLILYIIGIFQIKKVPTIMFASTTLITFLLGSIIYRICKKLGRKYLYLLFN